MELTLLCFLIYFVFSNSLPIDNGPQIAFKIINEGIYKVGLENLNSTIYYKDTDLFITINNAIENHIGGIDYNLRANIFLWRTSKPEFALYVRPIDESHNNQLGIKENTLLLKMNVSPSSDVSIDWIHNLVYYAENNTIIVFNMTNTQFGYLVIDTKRYLILDLKVNPLDSYIFWSDYGYDDEKGRIMRSSQDGSNQTVLIDSKIEYLTALAIDSVLKRIYWIDENLYKLSSTDFNGNDIKTILISDEFFTNSYSMDILGDDIYWSNYKHKSIFKTNKYGLIGNRINKLVKADKDIITLKVIDSSLQPNSTNRCIDNRCSHLCIPISFDTYRCVCPQIFYNKSYERTKCSELFAFNEMNTTIELSSTDTLIDAYNKLNSTENNGTTTRSQNDSPIIKIIGAFSLILLILIILNVIICFALKCKNTFSNAENGNSASNNVDDESVYEEISSEYSDIIYNDTNLQNRKYLEIIPAITDSVEQYSVDRLYDEIAPNHDYLEIIPVVDYNIKQNDLYMKMRSLSDKKKSHTNI